MAASMALSEQLTISCLVREDIENTGGDAADSVAVVGDLRMADGQSGGFSRQSSLQIEIDGTLEVSLALLHLTGLLVLTRFQRKETERGQLQRFESITLEVFKSRHTKETMPPSWPGSSEETLKKSLRKLLDKRTAGLFCSPCCHCDSDPQKAASRLKAGWSFNTTIITADSDTLHVELRLAAEVFILTRSFLSLNSSLRPVSLSSSQSILDCWLMVPRLQPPAKSTEESKRTAAVQTHRTPLIMMLSCDSVQPEARSSQSILKPASSTAGFGGELVPPLSLLIIEKHHSVNSANSELGAIGCPGHACHLGSTLL
ncbi:hypothetical protein FQN60_015416 [Etheostoma spectabile]|uniref:Uncharacterized protein n=1 Tax=Etheostoma spectabile TaxID=54343 RepID=A0A5J5CR43_9PERO|nr:hypothetical protein FQN60_015416 [Etheostoma spectabile]